MQAAFRDRPFIERFGQMGDAAQGYCKAWCQRNNLPFVNFGLDRPPFAKFPKLSSFIRHTPDLIVEFRRPFPHDHMLIECKGFGAEQTLRVKLEDEEALHNWQMVTGTPVAFFVHDSTNKRVSPTWLTLDNLTWMTPQLDKGIYPDNKKEYWKVAADVIEGWEPRG